MKEQDSSKWEHRATGIAGPLVLPPVGGSRRHEVRVDLGAGEIYILQPRAGSASALIATPTSLFSLPSTLRR